MMIALNSNEIARARALLEPPKVQARIGPVLGAAAFAALSALAFATAMVLAPPLVTERVAEQPAR